MLKSTPPIDVTNQKSNQKTIDDHSKDHFTECLHDDDR